MWIDTNSQVSPHEANSGTYTNIYQGFILNLGLNHKQYAVFISNQTKNMWFVPLIRNMNCAIIYIFVQKSHHVYDKYIHGLKQIYWSRSSMCLPHCGLSNKLTKELAGLHGESF